MYIWSFVVLWHPVSVEWRHYQLPIFVCQVSSSGAMIKTFSYSGWRQYILQIIFMALDGFRGLPDINLSRCMNPLVNFKFIFRKTKRKQKNTIVGVRLFFLHRCCGKKGCMLYLSAQPCLSFSDTKTTTPFHCDVQWVSESTLNFGATCSGKTNPQQNNNTQSFTPKEDFKEVLLLMSLRANQVYRHGHWSQVSFKHQTDPKALHSLPEEASLCSMISFPLGSIIYVLILDKVFQVFC